MGVTQRGDSRRVHTFIVITACATFLLVIAGGIVTSTESGLSVPDWPLSYGMLMPPMVGGIMYEHGHRMVATLVGILTGILAFWLWRVEKRLWVKLLGLIALGGVIVQGVLGGLTVLLLLPTPVSVAHATMAQSFFALMIVLALVTSHAWQWEPVVEMPGIGPARHWMLLTSICLFLQLILGSWMRHSHAGLAIPDLPLAYGHLVPPVNDAGLAAVNAIRQRVNLPPVSLEQIWIHFAHRLGAVIVAIVVVANVTYFLRTFRDDRRLREPALALLFLVSVQVLLGLLTVSTGKDAFVATCHVAVGALLLATSVGLTVRSYGMYRPPQRGTALSLVA